MADAPFWLERPGVLLDSFQFIPTREMTRNERLNALTRLLLIIVLILVFVGPRHIWLTVLVVGLLAIVALYFLAGHRREGFWPTTPYHERTAWGPARDERWGRGGWGASYGDEPYGRDDGWNAPYTRAASGWRDHITPMAPPARRPHLPTLARRDITTPENGTVCAHCHNTTATPDPTHLSPHPSSREYRYGGEVRPALPPLTTPPSHDPPPVAQAVHSPTPPATHSTTPPATQPASRKGLIGSVTTKLPSFFPRTGGRNFVPRSTDD